MNLMLFVLFTAPAILLVLGGYGMVRYFEANDEPGRHRPGE